LEKQHTAYLYAAAAVVFWSTAATAFKISLRFYGVLHLLLFAAATSTAILFAAVAVSGGIKRIILLPRKEIARSAMLGFLNPFLYYIVLLGAYSRLPAQEAQALNYTWPIVLVLLSIPMLGQRLRARDAGAILVSFSGVIVIATRGNPFSLEFSDWPGITLALGSTLIWSLYWILNTKDTVDGTVRMFLNFIFGLVYITAVALPLAGPLHLRGATIPGPVYVGIFEMGLTFLLWLKALRLSETTAAVGNLIYFAPFLSLVFIQTVAGEQVRLSSVAGLVLIIGGVALQRLRFESGSPSQK